MTAEEARLMRAISKKSPRGAGMGGFSVFGGRVAAKPKAKKTAAAAVPSSSSNNDDAAAEQRKAEAERKRQLTVALDTIAATGLTEIHPDPIPGGAPRGIFEQIGVAQPPL